MIPCSAWTMVPKQPTIVCNLKTCSSFNFVSFIFLWIRKSLNIELHLTLLHHLSLYFAAGSATHNINGRRHNHYFFHQPIACPSGNYEWVPKKTTIDLWAAFVVCKCISAALMLAPRAIHTTIFPAVGCYSGYRTSWYTTNALKQVHLPF